MPKTTLPNKPLYYDLFGEKNKTILSILRDPNKQRALERARAFEPMREILHADPSALLRDVPAGFLSQHKQWGQSHPYILDNAVLDLALNVVEKAGSSPFPYGPFLRVPFWCEFDHMMIGGKQEHFIGFFIYRDPDEEEGLLTVALLTPDIRTKTLLIHEQTGRWIYEQAGPCSSTGCEIARATREGQLYYVRQGDLMVGCACHDAGYTWSQIVKVIMHLLKHRHKNKPFVEQIVTRQNHPTRSKQAKQARKDTIPQHHGREVVIISLSAPVEVKRYTTPARSSGQTTIRVEEFLAETRSVNAHYRYLIPGEGRPWKYLHIVPVESYDRRVHGAPSQTVYHVIP